MHKNNIIPRPCRDRLQSVSTFAIVEMIVKIKVNNQREKSTQTINAKKQRAMAKMIAKFRRGYSMQLQKSMQSLKIINKYFPFGFTRCIYNIKQLPLCLNTIKVNIV